MLTSAPASSGTDLEKRFWSWLESLSLTDLLDPANGDQFRRMYTTSDQEAPPNPVFAYPCPAFSPDAALRQCDIFSRELDNCSALKPVVAAYLGITEETRRLVQLIGEREDGRDIAERLSGLYGKPSEAVVAQAMTILRADHDPEPPLRTVTAQELAGTLEERVAELGLDWRLEITPAISARVAVSSLHKRIRIKYGERFSPREVRRLLAHEIEVHVFRGENGARQPFMIFQHGFPGYLETEEGLAAYAEHRLGLLDHDQLRIYAARILAADLALNGSFGDVFTALREYLSPDQAYAITQRVKRGLTDTTQSGGFTKDQCYLSGYLAVSQAADAELINLLYAGKVGLADIPLVRKLTIAGILHKPKFLPQWLCPTTPDAVTPP
jgi:uncharacterized protein (TIGR02421 family)